MISKVMVRSFWWNICESSIRLSPFRSYSVDDIFWFYPIDNKMYMKKSMNETSTKKGVSVNRLLFGYRNWCGNWSHKSRDKTQYIDSFYENFCADDISHASWWRCSLFHRQFLIKKKQRKNYNFFRIFCSVGKEVLIALKES